MTRAVSVLMFFVCGSVLSCIGTHVHAGPGDQVMTDAQEPPHVFRYRADHYRDPFVPKSVVPNAAGASLQGQDASRRTVKVLGTMSSAEGRWATLEFEDGERLIVMPGQFISSYSLVVKRITEQGVTLSAIEEKTKPQAEKTYWLDEERALGERRFGGNS